MTYEINVNTGYSIGGGFYSLSWEDLPTSEGWYWHKKKDSTLEIREVVLEKDVLGILICGYWEEFISCVDEGGLWLGPLPEPAMEGK